ncbi:hypothetical protein EDD16DRAFT_1519879 [Pisolithus croceorrhizus]|nr:hypothetical protein EV401DRAFT_1892934 [Pisolithus croceorrhizus]KAI6117862.1 hypothetical protein EDD16DRAFT_1519879 [Pisolithus croceorrhizus]KAI6163290.1 hypothetical protein EDD17DRAFT_1507303 [Pisolithus thermaeus]
MDDDFLDKVTGAVVLIPSQSGRSLKSRNWRTEVAASPPWLVQTTCCIPVKEMRKTSLIQVEFNTYPPDRFSRRQWLWVGKFCRVVLPHPPMMTFSYLNALTNYYDVSPYLKSENFPAYDTTAQLAEGLAVVHKAYDVPKTRIIREVTPHWSGLHTFEELAVSVLLDTDTRALRLTVSPALSPSGSHSTLEVSTVYFRAGYVPSDYPLSAHYTTRFTLEALLLIGIGTGTRDLRETWMSMWSLDDPDPPVVSFGYSLQPSINEPKETVLARALAVSLVLKPQREGGRNDAYKQDIPPFLETLPAQGVDCYAVDHLSAGLRIIPHLHWGNFGPEWRQQGSPLRDCF